MALLFESSLLQTHVQNGQTRVTTKENIEGQHTHLSSMPIQEDAQKALENEGKTIKPK